MTATIRPHTFRPADLVGGHIVLDLANTVTARDADPVDWLDGYPRLLEWAALTDAFPPATLTALREHAERDPTAATAALARTRDLREALHDLVSALIHGTDPAQAAAAFERHWKHAAAAAHLTLDGGTPAFRATPETSGLDFLSHELALHAAEFVKTLPHDRARTCPGGHCGWLFLDTSRGGRRRWCDMATCGNSAKGRTHYQRRRRAAGSDSPNGDPTQT